MPTFKSSDPTGFSNPAELALFTELHKNIYSLASSICGDQPVQVGIIWSALVTAMMHFDQDVTDQTGCSGELIMFLRKVLQDLEKVRLPGDTVQ